MSVRAVSEADGDPLRRLGLPGGKAVAFLVIVAAILAVSGAMWGCLYRRQRIEKDDRPVFHINPVQPFRLLFGRGSGWEGLDTIELNQGGLIVIYRSNLAMQANVMVRSWETASLQLQPESVAEVLKAVESNRLMELHRAYHEPRIADGTQWVLWIKQAEHEKSVYFNNRFPSRITQFADQLDAILIRADLGKVQWQPVLPSDWRQHERELWDSLNR